MPLRDRMTVGFVTCIEIGGITPDDALVASALARMATPVVPVAWDDGTPTTDFAALVLRSPWNYHLQPNDFLDWVTRAASRAAVYNEPDVVRWNAHKGYLFELERAGIAIAPTILCKSGETHDLQTIMLERGWPEVVVKPAVSASSYMTDRIDARTLAQGQRLLDDILESRDALVQPFAPEILERGERCLVFFDGRFSHAIQKSPFTKIGGGGAAVAAQPDEIRVAQRALDVVAPTPLYARVDLLRGADGIDRLMELELIDPELYLRFDQKSPERFAAALKMRLDALQGR